ncbi:nucleoside hydrolase [Curtobacterium sp. RRHDQ66]|uniref:nucleoside hydrolase n=1 Tax=Curtobacterium guangdongense TaxID=3413380 RepID=UPI003BF01661
MTSSQHRRSVIIDCDAGVDDGLALAYCASVAPARIAAVTTVAGNNRAAVSARNVRLLLRLLGLPETIQVVAGAERMLHGRRPDTAELVHGDDGLGGQAEALGLPDQAEAAQSAAAEFLVTYARSHGPVTIVALGPLTNLALALQRDRQLPDFIDQVVVMGGAVEHPGNGSPTAEANIRNDPQAANVVLNAGWNITMVPLDVTMQHRFTTWDAARLASSRNEAVRLLARASQTYLTFHEGRHFAEREGALHDPVAMAVALRQVELSLAPHMHVVVDEREGLTYGMTIADGRRKYLGYPLNGDENCQVVLQLKDDFRPDFVDALMHLEPVAR